MYISSPASHNQTAKHFQCRRKLEIAVLGVLLNNALQAQKEAPDDCENTFFNTTNFHRVHVHLFKQLSPQISDHVDSNSLITTMIIHILNQNHSPDTSHGQKESDAEKLKIEVINVFIHTYFDNSSKTKVSGYRIF